MTQSLLHCRGVGARFLSGTLAPALPLSLPAHWLAKVGRISSDPSRGHMVSPSEAPHYGLAKLLLLSTVLFKCHLWFLCERERLDSRPHHAPGLCWEATPSPTPSALLLTPLLHLPPPPVGASSWTRSQDEQGPTLPPGGTVVCRQP